MNTGDITLEEFLDFVRDNSEEYANAAVNRHGRQRSVNASGDEWESDRPRSRKGDIDPVRVSTASDDILGTSGNHSHNKRDPSLHSLARSQHPGSRWVSEDAESDAVGRASSRASSPEQRRHNDTSLEDNRLAVRPQHSVSSSSPGPVSRRLDPAQQVNGLSTAASRDHALYQHQLAVSYDSSLRHGEGDQVLGRPPLHKGLSTGNVHAIVGLTTSVEALGSIKHLEKHFPPPPTELGAAMNVILEGYLDKKSTYLGQWQKVINSSLMI